MIRTMPRSLRFALLAALLAPPLAAEQLLVGAADFHARKGVGHFFNSAGFIQGSLASGGDGCLVASVRLPHDAVITQMTLEVYDNRAVDDFRIDLKRKRRGNSVPAEVLAGASTSGASTIVQQIPVSLGPTGHLVQDAFVYYLSTDANCLEGTNHRIQAVRLDYEPALFADDFESGDTGAWNAPPPAFLSAWVSAIEFKNFGNYPWTIDSNLAAFWLEHGADFSFPCAAAPLELPHGATVAGLLANLWDTRGDRNETLALRRSVMASSATPATLASVSTSGSSGWQLPIDLTVSDAVIDNDTYWYWLELCLTGGNTVQAAEIGVQAVQVFYSLP
jgi:hypothetical protein